MGRAIRASLKVDRIERAWEVGEEIMGHLAKWGHKGGVALCQQMVQAVWGNAG